VFEELVEIVTSTSVLAYLKTSLYNWLSLIGLLLTLAAWIKELAGNRADNKLLVAPATLCLLLRIMEHLAVWKTTGIFISLLNIMLKVPTSLCFGLAFLCTYAYKTCERVVSSFVLYAPRIL
jgi:hypothetical protein